MSKDKGSLGDTEKGINGLSCSAISNLLETFSM